MRSAPVALLLAILQLPLPLPAARPKHLTLVTSTSDAPQAPGSKISLFVDVTPDPGIHVYAPGAKDYQPIALKIEPARGLTTGSLTYSKSQTMMFDGQKIPVYGKPFRLVQQATLSRSLKAGDTVTVAGTVTYQACTDEVCFIPASAPVEWTVTVK
jgi:DsbC/DsbD-like thiol-disulfide interchange protein